MELQTDKMASGTARGAMETKKEKIVVIILLSIAILLWFINQWLIDQVYIEEVQNVKIQQELLSIKRTNNLLKIELLHVESYQYLYQKAKSQGFIQRQFFFLK